MSAAATLARPYARAAFAHARDGGALEAFAGMLADAAAFAADAGVRRLLDDPRLPRPRRAELLLALGGERFDAPMRRLLAALGERGRLPLLGEVAAQFERLRADHERRAAAVAVSARPLDPAQEERLRRTLERRTGRAVALEARIDEQLLGGAVVRVGDRVLDGSLRGRLARLARSLAGHPAE